MNRHQILEEHLDYHESFFKTFPTEKWQNEILKYLDFKNTSEFLNWIFKEIHLYDGLNYRLINCGSPYQMYTVPLLLRFISGNYQDCFADEIKKAIEGGYFGGIPTAGYPIVDLNHARIIINIKEIRKSISDLDLVNVFKQNKEGLKNIFEILCQNVYSVETWTTFFMLLPRKKIILGIEIVMELYLESKTESKKVLFQALYALLLKSYNFIPNIYSILKSNNELIKLTDGILSKTDDLDLPFVTTNYSAKSTEEYLNYLRIDEELNKSLQIEEDKLNKINDELNNLKIQLYKQIEKTEALLLAKQEPFKRIEELKTFTGLKPSERLSKMIYSGKSLFYFPDYFYTDTLEVISSLNKDEVKKLDGKLKTAKKGILKELKKKVTEYRSQIVKS